MTNTEREKRLAAIRWAVETGVARNELDLAFLLSELESALMAVHDLREESAAYRRGLEDGKVLGAAEEWRRLRKSGSGYATPPLILSASAHVPHVEPGGPPRG
jgi:hypothetical protein